MHDSKENKRVIAQNGQREDTCSIERHFPPVSRVSVRSALLLHHVLFLVRQSGDFLFVHAFAFENARL